MDNIDPNRLLAIINRIEADMARLSTAVDAVHKTLKNIKSELRQNGKKVETLEAGQQFLAGQFKQRAGTLYGIGRQMPPTEADD